MAADRLIYYKGFAVWITHQPEGWHAQITDTQGSALHFLPDAYPVPTQALIKAQEWIDQQGEQVQ